MNNLYYLRSNDELKALIKDETTLIIVDFFAMWCSPCRMIAPKFEELSKKYPAIFVKIDVDEFKVNKSETIETALQYDIEAVPTYVAIKGGQIVDVIVGASIENVEDMIKRWI
ncbi:Thioredoxin H-type isoform 2 [Schistosoma japonicum]|uniref:Thioredoxin n=2 Tax=Schistosoma japonicum TaxID=6182 RepID=C1LIS9_SCHJA|nr:Thioredoxin H4 [Schistosoma japonicum]TNN08941.1 Thioredoxin H-type isoform 2 [Schistosoma japonicum]CAX74607.1 thioredoxin [Schistosoma japonicum]